MIPICILAIENDSDRAFMEGLYENYHLLMYKEILKTVKDRWNAEDVMQSVLIKLIDKLSDLRKKDRNQLVNYILVACRNTAYNYVRDHSKGKEAPYEDFLDVSEFDSDGHRIELNMIKKEQLDSLAKIWPNLDARTRYLLEGYYILERPMEELGQELGLKPGSARMALSRARKKAFELLQKELEESR